MKTLEMLRDELLNIKIDYLFATGKEKHELMLRGHRVQREIDKLSK